MAQQQRAELQELLESIVDNVYFQPPSNVKMVYPCIVYTRETMQSDHADNSIVRLWIRYQITLIDRNPDSEMLDALASLPFCYYGRHFVADDLNHDVFNLYWKGM